MKKSEIVRQSVVISRRRFPCRSFRIRGLETVDFRIGEVYLFHCNNRRCPSKSSLWAIFDKRIGNDIYVESSSNDLRRFRLWHRLPDDYVYCRLATRQELGNFMFALAWFESRRENKQWVVLAK